MAETAASGESLIPGAPDDMLPSKPSQKRSADEEASADPEPGNRGASKSRAPSHKKPKLGFPGQENPGEEPDNGEMGESPSRSHSPAVNSPDAQEPPKPPVGWNRGIQGGLRTSFASSGLASLVYQPPDPPPSDDHYSPASSGPRETVSEGTADVTAEQAKDWIIPDFPPVSEFASLPDGSRKGTGRLFKTWCDDFVNYNKGRPETGQLLVDKALTLYVHGIGESSLPSSKKEDAEAGAMAYVKKKGDGLAVFFKSRVLAGSKLARALKKGQLDESSPNGQTFESGERVSLSSGMSDGSPENQLQSGGEQESFVTDLESPEERRKYFPGIPADSIFCVLCACQGHTRDHCPERICRFCQGRGHPSYGCPTRRRCTKCKQFGHAKDGCTEKLVLTPAEMVCAFCNAPEHTEQKCYNFWRHFRPDPSHTKKIKYLPVYCYSCGDEGHYGPECGLALKSGLGRSAWMVCDTWSKANLEQYVDPNSSELAIALCEKPADVFSNGNVAAFPPPPPPRGIHRRGNPDRRTVFQAEDDDEENATFIQPRVQKRPGSGYIQFSRSNRTGGNLDERERDRDRGRTQQARANPPLPPGPPPPLPSKPPRDNAGSSQRAWKSRPKRH